MELTHFSKKQTLWVFLIIYLFAIAIGSLIVLYGVKNEMDLVMITLLSTVSMTVVIFFFSNITKNASLYDPYWSVVPIVIVIQWILIYRNLSINVILLLLAVLI